MSVRVITQALVESAEKEMETTSKAFVDLINAFHPYAENTKKQTDEQMKERMKHEIAKGVIRIDLPAANPLVTRAKQMQLPDEFRRKLAERKRKP